MKLVTQEDLDQALLVQAAARSRAAVTDMRLIAERGAQDTSKTPWVTDNWGNNGVNAAKDDPTPVDGASAVANMAQNMVVLANANPAKAKQTAKKLQPAVEAAEQLTSFIAGDGQVALSADEARRLYTVVMRGLETAVKDTGVTPKDKKGQAIKLEDFIRNRGKEIEAGIEAASRREEGIEAGMQTSSLPRWQAGRRTPNRGETFGRS
jgi:hypothetical protein